MKHTPPTRATIIGSGPAGSTAAYHLARAGLDVTLIERSPFPRAKVCGEYISPAATSLLESLLPAHQLLTAGARRVDTFILQQADLETRWHAPHAAWSLSRETLDSLLLKKTQQAGAKVLTPASVRDVHYSSEHVAITLADGSQLATDIVIHADGSGRHDPAGPVPVAPNLIAHKCHLRIPSADPAAVTMRSCQNAYIGAIGIEGDQFTCAFVTTRALTHRLQNTDALLTHLWPQYRAAWRTSDWKSCGVPRSRYIAPGHARSFRIGNAAAAVDPVGGEGIGLALWAATQLGLQAPALAGLHALSPHEQLTQLTNLQRTFAAHYKAKLRTRVPACQLAAWLLMRPALVRTLWPISLAPRLSFLPFYRLTGKPRQAPLRT